jgi:hypothetical protein
MNRTEKLLVDINQNLRTYTGKCILSIFSRNIYCRRVLKLGNIIMVMLSKQGETTETEFFALELEAGGTLTELWYFCTSFDIRR